MLLLGVQGCGKSLAAKAAAGIFGVPLLRLDFGVLYSKYYGETERNLRKAFETAEVMAPCVLWLDEIEKGLATGDDDDGLSRRLLGRLLTWMSERQKPVFIVATANDIMRLPPEMVRKGRFDEIFFVDLPVLAEPPRHPRHPSPQTLPRPGGALTSMPSPPRPKVFPVRKLSRPSFPRCTPPTRLSITHKFCFPTGNPSGCR